MDSQRVERKLAAILHADVQGYSRLIGEDDAATLRVLTPYLTMLRTLVCQHGGRVVGSAGDSLLAEFPSVVAAVQGAIAMQGELASQNAALPPDRRIEFRMGINLGEVLVEGEELHGDGVNIAVRIERGVALDPNVAYGSSALLAEGLGSVSRPEEARRMAEQALRGTPSMVMVDWHLRGVGAAYYLAGRPEEAIAPLQQ